MSPSVAVRRSLRNTAAPAVSAPSSFVVIASRIVDADRLEVVLRGDHVGTIAGVKKHAATLLCAVEARFGCSATVDVQDHAGNLIFAATTAGGAL